MQSISIVFKLRNNNTRIILKKRTVLDITSLADGYTFYIVRRRQNSYMTYLIAHFKG